MTSLDALVSAYALTPDDKARLTRLLAEAYLREKAEAYQQAAATTAPLVTLHRPWTPGKADVTQAQAWASEQALSIANTYEELLRSELEHLFPVERAFVDLTGKIRQAVTAVKDWFESFLPWKSKQIAGYTTGKGANDGTRQWIDDLADEEDDGLFDADVTADLDRIRARVVPETSSGDECADYAGNDYGLDEIDALPSWPMHTNCPHELELYVV